LEYIWSPWRMDYIQSDKNKDGCILCGEINKRDSQENLILYRSDHIIVIVNRFPYTSGHLMVVPIVHKASIENLDHKTLAEMMELTAKAIEVLRNEYHPQGFNVGINIGEAAGAGILDHVHLHVVPRWVGDTSFISALGGTRVLPEDIFETYTRIKKAW